MSFVISLYSLGLVCLCIFVNRQNLCPGSCVFGVLSCELQTEGGPAFRYGIRSVKEIEITSREIEITSKELEPAFRYGID